MMSRSWLRLALAGLLGLGLAACAESTVDPTGRTWLLTELNGQPLVEGTIVDMTLTTDAVSGSSGCNQYNGAASFEDGAMTLGPEFAVTFMACEQPIMDQEAAYLAALAETTAYEVLDHELRLLDASDQVLMRFE